MKFRCPYCKHVFGLEPVAICPNCKKGVKVSERLRESLEKMKDSQENEKAIKVPGKRIFFSSNTPTFSFSAVPIVITVLLLGGVIYYRISKIPSKVNTIEFIDPKAMVEKAEKTSMTMVKKELWSLRMALEMFQRDCGRYPTTKEGIVALINNPGELTWKGPYVTFTRPDPWKHPYHYNFTNNTVILFSYGPDQTPNTADDVFPGEITDKDRTDYELPLPLLALPAPTNMPPTSP
ncbi:MAG: type II secretion system protein GspG [Kiritimatiellae bacterium]|nr:type II secretion system protein GspG [Kiritimatiellia bacterium]